MTEVIQEFVDSGSARLRVDREAGIIRGVKLLGLSSRNGRRYREDALASAAGLYEGAKVNINHPKGHPLSPRDYQDRLGVIRGVEFRSGQGLFGDLHFNPKHALSEQLVWDAEHASQNVGLSHNVLARVTRSGEDTVVEAITKVQSLDLVADPATTNGLFEQARGGEPPRDDANLTWDALTVEQLELHRPDVVRALREEQEVELAQLRQRCDELATREAAAARGRKIAELLSRHGLPCVAGGPAPRSAILSEQFLQSLHEAADEGTVERMIRERVDLLRAARAWSGDPGETAGRPRSRDQASFGRGGGRRCGSAAEFAALLRGR